MSKLYYLSLPTPRDFVKRHTSYPFKPLRTVALGLVQNYTSSRAWEDELGDWWDPTPLVVAGMSRYFDAADLLLRLRAVNVSQLGYWILSG